MHPPWTDEELETIIHNANQYRQSDAGSDSIAALSSTEGQASVASAKLDPMLYDETKLPAMLDFAEQTMLAANAPLYQMGGRLVHPVRLDRDSSDDEEVRRKEGALTIREISALRLREYMVEHVRFEKFNMKGFRKPFAAPISLANHFLARGDKWRMPILAGIVETPTLRKTGTLLEADGYDPESGLLLDKGGVVYPTVPDRPTRKEALSALAILKVPFQDFPFVKNAKGESPSFSVMLSAFLPRSCAGRSIQRPSTAPALPQWGPAKHLLKTRCH